MFYYLHYVATKFEKFFTEPRDRKHILYEALRKSFLEKLPDKKICELYRLKFNTWRSLKKDFTRMIRHDENAATLFFSPSKVGKREKNEPELVEKIIALRKKNLSVPDIKAILSAQRIQISYWKIDKILKAHNFPVLPRRTHLSKEHLIVPDEFTPPEAYPIEFPIIEKFESLNGSIFLFYPLLKALELDTLVERAGYPETSQIGRLNAVLSFLALKLINTKRLSHSNEYGLDRGLGLFAGMNVLPKTAWFSSYSFRVSRDMNRRFLHALNEKTEALVPSSGDFNLDFTTIPHWGDESVLEKNWSGTRHIGIKRKYGDAEIKQADMSDAILEFIDFYASDQRKISCLIFDSKFTTYRNLNQLNKDRIKFLTLRTRSAKMIKTVESLSKESWQPIRLGKNFRRKYRNLLVYESTTSLTDYDGLVRQLVVKNNGREHPAFIITNDFDISISQAILKYGKRWLVEQAISEQVEFYHLNRLNSSIVVKVDFDLTMTILADTVYKLFKTQIPGFENSKAEKIYRLLIKNYTQFHVGSGAKKEIKIVLNKKAHLPLLYETDWFNRETKINWLDNYRIKYEIGSSL